MRQDGDTRVARRYACALFQASRRLGKMEAVQADVESLADLWGRTPALRDALVSPLVTMDRKHALIGRLFEGKVDTLTSSFLHVLVDKRREAVVPEVREEFVRLADDARGLIRAHVQVAAPIDEAQRASLVAGLERRTGKRIELTVETEPAVIGGAVVRMQDTVIDGSVRGALERLREQMLHE